jgi:hypothetical protein
MLQTPPDTLIPALIPHARPQAIKQCTGRVDMPTHRGHEMEMLVALIGLTGTDFSRNLPQLSGKTVHEYLPDIWTALAMSYDPAATALRVPEATDLLVAHLYRTKFRRLQPCDSGLAPMLDALKSSTLAQRTKDSLPSVGRVQCTVRNANWVLAYWSREDGETPDPIQPAYGFRTLPCGATAYDD